MHEKKPPKKRAEAPAAESAAQDLDIYERHERMLEVLRESLTPEGHALATGIFAGFADKCQTAEGKGWISLYVGLGSLKSDPAIRASPTAMDFLELMEALVHWSVTDRSGRSVIDEFLTTYESDKNRRSVSDSHLGHRKAREYAERRFMEASEPWPSLQKAAEAIKDGVLAESNKYPRPLKPLTVQERVHGWLGEYVKRDSAAWKKLSLKAQARIQRARASAKK